MRSFTVKSTTESGLLVAITVIMALIAVYMPVMGIAATLLWPLPIIVPVKHCRSQRYYVCLYLSYERGTYGSRLWPHQSGSRLRLPSGLDGIPYFALWLGGLLGRCFSYRCPDSGLNRYQSTGYVRTD